MTFLYRILQNFDPNAVPDANLVVGCFDFSIAYKTSPGVGKTRTLTIAYHDPSGVWLVGAEPQIMSKLPTPRVTLQAWINGLGLWHTWRVDGHNAEDFANVIVEAEIPSSVSSAKPVNLGDGRSVIGGQATAGSRLGDFSPSEIEVGTTWRGDHITLLTNIIDEIKVVK